jgi:hypothetical protein
MGVGGVILGRFGDLWEYARILMTRVVIRIHSIIPARFCDRGEYAVLAA